VIELVVEAAAPVASSRVLAPVKPLATIHTGLGQHPALTPPSRPANTARPGTIGLPLALLPSRRATPAPPRHPPGAHGHRQATEHHQDTGDRDAHLQAHHHDRQHPLRAAGDPPDRSALPGRGHRAQQLAQGNPAAPHHHHHRLAILLAHTATDRPPNTTRTPAIGMPISRLTTTTGSTPFEQLGLHLIDQLPAGHAHN
jgi:hypothetical protein